MSEHKVNQMYNYHVFAFGLANQLTEGFLKLLLRLQGEHSLQSLMPDPTENLESFQQTRVV